MRTFAAVALTAGRAVTAMFPQRLVALQDGAIRERDLLDVAIVLTIDEPIDASDGAIVLGPLTPFDLGGAAHAPW